MDICLHYIEKGCGEPLILLHGNGEDSSYFSEQISFFSKRYRVIAVDTRGHGKSPRGTVSFTIRQFADDLHDFMEELGLAKAHILGFSDGGNIALVFAIKYPEMVDRLILNGANLDMEGLESEVQKEILDEYELARRRMETETDEKGAAAGRKAVELLELMIRDPNIPVEELEQVKARTLVIAGTEDMIKREHTELIGSRIPGAETVIVQGSHFAASENPAEFNRAVERFLMS
ncbi:MAG: alpha/beta hydrolase [Eubacteriales bacterium]|nr:alpha/beta hydrolase [Eubacteriales bacterium]